MSAKIISDEEFRNLKERILKDKKETLENGGTIRTVRYMAFSRMTAFSGIKEEERAYTGSQLAEIFEIM